MGLRHVEVVSVPVTDQDRAKAFYVERLGFREMIDTTFGEDMRWVQLGLPGAQTSITLVTWFDAMPAGSVQGLVLHVDDVDDVFGELSGRGVEFSGEPYDTPWGRFAGFADPDGNGWLLHEPSR